MDMVGQQRKIMGIKSSIDKRIIVYRINGDVFLHLRFHIEKLKKIDIV